MKKIALAALIAAPLCACDRAPVSDFDTVSAAVNGATAVADTVVSVPATNAMLAIYAQDKNSQFQNVSGDVARQITAGNCLVETVSETEYRVFCGSADDVVADNMWAVSVVKAAEVAEETTVAEETPAVETPAEEAPAAEATEEVVAEPVAEPEAPVAE